MGLNFRKSFKIAPGVRLNVGKKGISSVSVGGKGARVSLGKNGTRTTVGIPGSGLSYSSYKPHQAKKAQSSPPPLPPQNFAGINQDNPINRDVSLLLGIGILLMPYIFAWFTLREGYSIISRVVSFVWMIAILTVI